jgi:ketosteroid isomerase-like protein
MGVRDGADARDRIDRFREVIRSLLALLGVAALLASCAEPGGPTAIDVVTAQAAVDSIWTKFAEAADRHDADAFGALLTEDASVVYSGQPTTQGRAGAQNLLLSLHTGADVTSLRIVPEDFKMSDFLATQTGIFEDRYTKDGKEMARTGRFTLVAVRGEDRIWRIWKLMALVDTEEG